MLKHSEFPALETLPCVWGLLSPLNTSSYKVANDHRTSFAELDDTHAVLIVAVLRGFGAPSWKSSTLFPPLVQPLIRRSTAFVFPGAGADPLPRKHDVVLPYPRKSTMLSPMGHAPDSAVRSLTSATFPPLALIAIVPLASGDGSCSPAAPADPS